MREYHVFSAMVAEAPRNLGRRISRRLSMSVAKVPTFIQSKFRTDVDVADFSASGGVGVGGVTHNNGQWWPQQLRRSRPVTLHIILPNGIERTVSASAYPISFACSYRRRHLSVYELRIYSLVFESLSCVRITTVGLATIHHFRDGLPHLGCGSTSPPNTWEFFKTYPATFIKFIKMWSMFGEWRGKSGVSSVSDFFSRLHLAGCTGERAET